MPKHVFDIYRSYNFIFVITTNILSLYWRMELCISQRNTCFRDKMKLFKNDK